ncbi:unnamed protein product [Leptosia nina]|uniref:Uncharacterized protein n=1 Tax=Leptosia nina TaxID=320188 RepID=A0AAV1JXM6_9NEOP
MFKVSVYTVVESTLLKDVKITTPRRPIPAQFEEQHVKIKIPITIQRSVQAKRRFRIDNHGIIPESFQTPSNYDGEKLYLRSTNVFGIGNKFNYYNNDRFIDLNKFNDKLRSIDYDKAPISDDYRNVERFSKLNDNSDFDSELPSENYNMDRFNDLNKFNDKLRSNDYDKAPMGDDYRNYDRFSKLNDNSDIPAWPSENSPPINGDRSFDESGIIKFDPFYDFPSRRNNRWSFLSGSDFSERRNDLKADKYLKNPNNDGNSIPMKYKREDENYRRQSTYMDSMNNIALTNYLKRLRMKKGRYD